MTDNSINLKVGIEVLLKIESLTENIRKVGNIQGWMGRDMIFVEIPDDKNIQHFATFTPLLVGFVNDGFTFGFKSKLIMRLKILSHHIFVIEYPRESKKVNLRKIERYKVNITGNLRLIQEGLSYEEYPIIEITLKDINPQGCGIITNFKLKKGEKIFLNFVLPPDNIINNLPGLVVNVQSDKSDHNELGVKFFPQDKHKEYIDRYISIINEIKQMAGISDL
jgi:hypothetical protein